MVVATGGLSIPKIGATDLGYRLAQQFNVPLVGAPRPGAADFDGAGWQPLPNWRWHCPCRSAPAAKRSATFDEDPLHPPRPVGPGGAANLQLLARGHALAVNLAPTVDLPEALQQAKARSRKLIANELAAGAQPPGRCVGAARGRMAAPCQ